MTPMSSPPLPRTSDLNRLSRVVPGHRPVPRKRKTAGWRRGRRPEMQPWRRGRIRPSNCHDLTGQE